MTKSKSVLSLAIAFALFAVAAITGAALITAGQTITADAIAPAASPAVVFAGDAAGVRKCGSAKIQASPRLVVKKVRATGATCAKAKKMLRADHKSQEPSGRKLKKKRLRCDVTSRDNRVNCAKGKIKISFTPDCTDKACNI